MNEKTKTILGREGASRSEDSGLLPCPFCGSRAIESKSIDGIVSVGCSQVCVVFDAPNESALPHLRRQWNRRAPLISSATQTPAATERKQESGGAAASTDTERLDWLEHVLGKCPLSVCDRVFIDSTIGYDFFMANSTLREAIDAARGKGVKS